MLRNRPSKFSLGIPTDRPQLRAQLEPVASFFVDFSEIFRQIPIESSNFPVDTVFREVLMEALFMDDQTTLPPTQGDGLETSTKSLQRIYRWHTEGLLRVNRKYQRKLVWTTEEKQKLIESILNDYPIPAIILSGEPGAEMEIIDGMQRLHTIIAFIEQKFQYVNGEYFDIDSFPTAAQHINAGKSSERPHVENGGDNTNPLSLISPKESSAILDYEIPISILRRPTQERVNDVFRRINSYGRQLSDQERRQAGVTSVYADAVRTISATLRNDGTHDITDMDKIPEIEYDLPIAEMTKVSIDLPKSRQGYSVSAEDTIWSRHGILNGIGIRDSKDEQCIADIVASVALGEMLERQRKPLDDAYNSDSPKGKRIVTKIETYPPEKLVREILFSISELDKIGQASNAQLKSLLYRTRNTNEMDSQFAVFVYAVHSLTIKGDQKFTDYEGIANALRHVATDHLSTGRDSVSPQNRMRNVNVIKGILSEFTESIDPNERDAWSNSYEIEGILRSSRVESSRFEFKQGRYSLDPKGRAISKSLETTLLQTICAIGNIPSPPGSTAGYIIFGIADNLADAKKIQDLDDIEYVEIASDVYVVGITREIRFGKISRERYLQGIRNVIEKSDLEDSLKQSALEGLRFGEASGHELFIVEIPAQPHPMNFNGKYWVRSSDQTVEVSPNQIADLFRRFDQRAK